MVKAYDDFTVGTADVDLASHTPTGPNAGTGWTALFSAGITVRSVENDTQATTNANGNRYKADTDLGIDEMDVQIDIKFISTVDTGNSVSGGPHSRVDTQAAYEYIYSWTTGVTFGSFTIKDTDGEDATEEEWVTPEDPKTLRIETRTSDQRGFAADVGSPLLQKSARTSNLKPGVNFAGFQLLDFSGEVDPVFGDNFISRSGGRRIFSFG